MSQPVVVQRAGYPEVRDQSGYTLLTADFKLLQIDKHSAWSCADKESPLGIPSRKFPFFISSLHEALKRQSFYDADVRLQGSSSCFFSCAIKPFPQTTSDRAQLFMSEYGRVWRTMELDAIEARINNQWPSGVPGQRPFDSLFRVGLSPDPSDIDVQISSDLAFEFAREIARDRGVPAERLRFHNPAYNFLIKEISDTEFLYLNRWVAEWQDELNRGVSIAFFESKGPPKRDQGISSQFEPDDWVVLSPQEALG